MLLMVEFFVSVWVGSGNSSLVAGIFVEEIASQNLPKHTQKKKT